MSLNIPCVGGTTITDGNTLTIDSTPTVPVNSAAVGSLYVNTSGTFPAGTIIPANTQITYPSITTTTGTGAWSYGTSATTLNWPQGEQPTQADIALSDMVERIRSLSVDKLECIGAAFKRSMKRYKALDKATNLAREIQYFDDLEVIQEDIWDEIAIKVGHRNYDVRDALWDALAANLVKKDLKQADFITLNMPYGLSCISE